jgi:Protein of unknown function (DUF3822)
LIYTEKYTSVEPLVSVEALAFDTSVLSNYHLCIEIGHDKFRYCVIDSSKNQCICLEDFEFDSLVAKNHLLDSLHSLYQQHAFLALNNWKAITVTFNTPYFTLVPTDLFRKEYIATYLQLILGRNLSENDQVMSSPIESIDARNVFSVEKKIWDWLLNTYSLHSPDVHHQTDALIKNTFKQITTKGEPTACLHFEDEYVTVVVVNNSQLLLCNKFAYKIAADMTYFVLFVLDNLKIKSDKINVYLSGEITPYSENYESLTQFLPNMTFSKLPQELSLSSSFEDLPEHRYLSLYNNFLI